MRPGGGGMSRERMSLSAAACVDTFQRWLELPDASALLLMLAVIEANRVLGDDPVWPLFVGPPGGGKTEMLAAAAGLPDVHPAATLTEAALLSGTSRKEVVAGAKGGLLREIGDFGIVLCKDFGSVLSMHRDARSSLLAALREVYDGSWTRHVGTDGGRTLSWSGKVGLIAGCTPAIDSHHAVMGSMDERFVLFRLPQVDADKQARRALTHAGHERAMRVELAEAVETALRHVDHDADLFRDDERLVRLATLAVRCRSAVERDGYSREIVRIPDAEAPGRLALVLRRILDGLAVIGADEATAWGIVTKVALDSMESTRRAALEYLLAKPEPRAVTVVAEALGYPTSTTRRTLEDLAAHGLVTRESRGQGKADYWRSSAWLRDRWPTVPEMSGEMNDDRSRNVRSEELARTFQ
jgi:DNA-binding transcriptional ArsR family regulator